MTTPSSDGTSRGPSDATTDAKATAISFGPADPTESDVDPSDVPGEPPTIYLHIGTTKSGTSYLQRVLSRNKTLLAELGVLTITSGHGITAKTTAGEQDEQVRVTNEWRRLAERMLSWSGPTAVLSNEIISFAQPEQVRRMVESLQPAGVVVILTARDLVRVLPSAWQNKIKHGRGWDFASYLGAVVEESPGRAASRSFWHQHDLVAIAKRWANVVGSENVVIVPVPPSSAGPDALWQQFSSILGMPTEGFDIAQDQGSNLSMGYVETELLRKLNRKMRADHSRDTQRAYLQSYLANEILRPDPSQAETVRRPTIPPEIHDWAIERSKVIVSGLRKLGVRVVGDLDDLIPPPLSGQRRAAAAAAAADTPELAEGVVRALALLVSRVVELEATLAPDRGEGPSPRSTRRMHRKHTPEQLKKRAERRRRAAGAAESARLHTAGTADTVNAPGSASGGTPESEAPPDHPVAASSDQTSSTGEPSSMAADTDRARLRTPTLGDSGGGNH